MNKIGLIFESSEIKNGSIPFKTLLKKKLDLFLKFILFRFNSLLTIDFKVHYHT